MTLELTIKLKTYESVTILDVRSYYLGKRHLEINLSGNRKQYYKLPAVISIKEAQ